MPTRLQEPAFLVLTALAEQPLHGYAITQAVHDLSAGEVTIRVGTLYGALDRLAGRGLIEVDREEMVDSRVRRYYRLTDAGVAALTAEARVLERRASRALEVLGRRPSQGVPGTTAGGLA